MCRTRNFVTLLCLCMAAQLPAQDAPAHPGQAVVDLLLEYLAVRYPEVTLQEDLLYVSIARQTLFHVRGGRSLAIYPVSTALLGAGNVQDSHRTPTGLHRVAEKLGADVPELGIFRDRVHTGELADPDFAGVDKDWITSRILWLEGLEPGVNQGPGVDSKARHIYIHGTANERAIGTACSMGCVRMLNGDVIRLFEAVPDGTPVVILDN
ncbi:MAG: L,D-transpeptidase [Flavobacteriales bacterium]